EWSAARDLLQGGTFAQFFGKCGRADLVRAAEDANAQTNPDAALTTFVTALPGVRTQTPRLDINPRRFLLGSLLVGETRQLQLTIKNVGQGMLNGNIAVTKGEAWVSLAAGRQVAELPLSVGKEHQVTIHVNTHGLPANQAHAAKLTVVTNGG